jgi:hypothetical protein
MHYAGRVQFQKILDPTTGPTGHGWIKKIVCFLKLGTRIIAEYQDFFSTLLI